MRVGTTDREVPAEDQNPPSDDEALDQDGDTGDELRESSEPGTPAPPQGPTPRERELESRLRRQGSELAKTQQAAAAALAQLTDLQGVVTQLAATQSADKQAEAQRREQQREAYLASLPADERVAEKVRLLEEEVKTLKQPRADVPPARTREQPDQRHQETPQEYQLRRAREIVAEANTEFGVKMNQDDLNSIPEEAWNDESTFYREVMRAAARRSKAEGSEEGDVANKSNTNKGKQTPKTEAEIRAEVRAEVREEMGVGSPATPKAAARRGKAPTEDDVRSAVQTYDSRQGPRANIARLRKLRENMPA